MAKSIAPLLLIGGGLAALVMSKKKKATQEDSDLPGLESVPTVPNQDSQGMNNAQKCDVFLSQLYVQPDRVGEMPILAIAVEEQILPYLEDRTEELIEDGAIDVAHVAPELAIEVLNHIAPPCNWQHEFTGDYFHLVYPNDERAKSIYSAVTELAADVTAQANEEAGVGFNVGVKKAGLDEQDPEQAGFDEKEGG